MEVLISNCNIHNAFIEMFLLEDGRNTTYGQKNVHDLDDSEILNETEVVYI